MQIGIHLPHIGRKAGPDAIRRGAVQAEDLGFADVWVSEHIIVPKDGGYPPSPNFWDPVLTLTWAAACTERVRLGTSVLVLPMRHPLPLAKELATLQNLSKGRLILGAGVGWLEAEFDALGVPFKERGRRMDEGIAMMRAVWSQDPVSFDAKWIPAKIEAMRSQPQPVAPIQIGMGATGCGCERIASIFAGIHLASNETGSCDHTARIMAMPSSMRRPRSLNGTPSASNSASSQPTPAPRINRPPDRFCRVANSLASGSGWRIGRTRTLVPSPTRLV